MTAKENSNPLLETCTIPPLDRIKPEHFTEALDHALEGAQQKLEQLKTDSTTPDFENTVVKIDEIFEHAAEIINLLAAFVEANGTEEIQDIFEESSKKLSELSKDVFQDSELAARFAKVPKPDGGEDLILYESTKSGFEEEGAFLNAKDQERICEIDDELIELSTKYNENLRDSRTSLAVLFTDLEELAGVPETIVASLREAAQEAGHDSGWLVSPENSAAEAILENAENRSTRKRVWEATGKVGATETHNNAPIIKQMQALRHERATMLGYENYAEYAINSTMPENAAEAHELMTKARKGALAKLEKSLPELQEFARQNGGPDKLEAWDVDFWVNRYSKEKFGYDHQEFSKYLPLDKAIDGFFKTAEKIFGVTFTENSDYPRYHPDVRAYDVVDNKTGEHLGVLYDDLFARNNKSSGAWALPLQSKKGDKPKIASISMNLLKPAEGKTTLLTTEELATLFHEGGHALHDLLGTKTRHVSLQGFGESSSEYAEFFSTVMENWPRQAECLDLFAQHFETGEKVPADLLRAKKEASKFFIEHGLYEVTHRAINDLDFHTMTPGSYKNVQSLSAAPDEAHPFANLLGGREFTRFDHLFYDGQSDYAAGYYGYEWAEALAEIGFAPFKEKGIFNPEQCAALKQLYEVGSSQDEKQAFERYIGKPLTTDDLADALLKSIDAKPEKSSVRGIEPKPNLSRSPRHTDKGDGQGQQIG